MQQAAEISPRAKSVNFARAFVQTINTATLLFALNATRFIIQVNGSLWVRCREG
jgi:hypothetical protein